MGAIGRGVVFGAPELVVVGLVAAAYWVPAVRALPRVAFPAPLDDVYIYFDFARETAGGCVLCWSPEGGYSSGATSPPYALALALGYLVGLRGDALGLAAGAIAIAGVADFARSLARLCGRAPLYRALALGLVLGVPLLDWTWFSGMEAALAAALLGRALLAVERARAALPDDRARLQLAAGAWLAGLAWSRPEATPLALALSVAIAQASGDAPVAGTIARAAGPTMGVLGLTALANLTLTGEAAAAGAVRKLVTTDPYATPLERTGVVLTNLVRLVTHGVEGGLGGLARAGMLVAIAALGLGAARTRWITGPLLGGALAALGLVCLNTTAPYQNLRYLAPTLSMLLAAVAIGVAAAFRRSRPLGLGTTAALAWIALGSTRDFPRQIEHFSASARNIAEQQVEVGRRLAALEPKPKRVFVGDAGAIPYASGLDALDGLGLGGERDLPFARASVHGVGAVIELIERLPHERRPDVLAIYDAWWPGLSARFGEPLFSVAIEGNVICGDPLKSVYRAHWDALEDRAEAAAGSLARIDVADLVDERAHGLTFTQPAGGYVVEAERADTRGRSVWDAGRALGPGQWIALDAGEAAARGEVVLAIRTDSAPGSPLAVELDPGGRVEALVAPGRDDAAWREARAELGAVDHHARVRIVAGERGLRVFALRFEPR